MTSFRPASTYMSGDDHLAIAHACIDAAHTLLEDEVEPRSTGQFEWRTAAATTAAAYAALATAHFAAVPHTRPITKVRDL